MMTGAPTYLQNQLKRRMGLLGISVAKLERDADLPPGRVKNILLGKSLAPRIDTLEAISRALGCTVADLTQPPAIGGPADHVEDPPVDVTPIANNMIVDELDVRASAGGGSLVDGHETLAQWQLPTQMIRGITATNDADLKFIRVVGDSMLPTLHPGQRVMVDTSDRSPSPAGIFVVWDGLGFVVKRLELLPHSDPLSVRIISDNPRYQPYERTLDEAFIQGRVIGGWVWM